MLTFFSVRFWLNSFFFPLQFFLSICNECIILWKSEHINSIIHSQKFSWHLLFCKILSMFSVFWMTEVTHLLFLLLLIFPRNRNQDTCIWVPQTWLYKILGMICFYFQKAISGKEITIDLEMVKNNTWKK